MKYLTAKETTRIRKDSQEKNLTEIMDYLQDNLGALELFFALNCKEGAADQAIELRARALYECCRLILDSTGRQDLALSWLFSSFIASSRGDRCPVQALQNAKDSDELLWIAGSVKNFLWGS